MKMPEKVSFDKVELDYELPSITRHVTQELITKNACVSLDFNPIHVDPVWAKKVNLYGVGKTIAHGMMTMTFLGQLVTDWCYADGGKLKSMDVKLIWPVFPGDTITCKGKVVAKHPRGEGQSFVDLEISAENQDGQKVAVGKAEVILP